MSHACTSSSKGEINNYKKSNDWCVWYSSNPFWHLETNCLKQRGGAQAVLPGLRVTLEHQSIVEMAASNIKPHIKSAGINSQSCLLLIFICIAMLSDSKFKIYVFSDMNDDLQQDATRLAHEVWEYVCPLKQTKILIIFLSFFKGNFQVSNRERNGSVH